MVASEFLLGASVLEVLHLAANYTRTDCEGALHETFSTSYPGQIVRVLTSNLQYKLCITAHTTQDKLNLFIADKSILARLIQLRTQNLSNAKYKSAANVLVRPEMFFDRRKDLGVGEVCYDAAKSFTEV